VGALSKEIDATPEQAAGAAGTLFAVAKSRLKADEFSQIAKAVPGMNALLNAAPASSAAVGTSGLSTLSGSPGGLANESGAGADVHGDEIRRGKRWQSTRRRAPITRTEQVERRSFGPQDDRRLEARRSAGGQISGDHHGAGEGDQADGQRERIVRRDLVKLGSEQVRTSDGRGNSDEQADDQQLESVAQYELPNVSTAGAERHPDPNLRGALCGQVRHHSVETDDRQGEREYSKCRRELRDETFGHQGCIDLVPRLGHRD
jgi:hypothetical protein